MRFELLDITRFFAAIAVVLFHYMFRGWAADDMSPLSFEDVGGYFKYGYLGVQLFFMISDFVILLSVQGRNANQFVVSRVTRLYPAYWAGVILTSLIAVMIGGELYQIELSQFLINLTMLQSFVGIEHIDGVYWTLTYEIVFYFWVYVLLKFNLQEKIYAMIVLFLLFSSLSFIVEIPRPIRLVLLTQYSPYFMSGALFFLSFRDGFDKLKVALLLWAMVLASLQVDHQLIWISGHYLIGTWSTFIAVGIIMLFYGFFLLLVKFEFNIKIKYASILGALTYPLYLIHQNIGYMLISCFAGVVNKYYIILFVLAIVLLCSWLIHVYIEKKYGPILKKALIRVIY